MSRRKFRKGNQCKHLYGIRKEMIYILQTIYVVYCRYTFFSWFVNSTFASREKAEEHAKYISDKYFKWLWFIKPQIEIYDLPVNY